MRLVEQRQRKDLELIGQFRIIFRYGGGQRPVGDTLRTPLGKQAGKIGREPVQNGEAFTPPTGLDGTIGRTSQNHFKPAGLLRGKHVQCAGDDRIRARILVPVFCNDDADPCKATTIGEFGSCPSGT